MKRLWTFIKHRRSNFSSISPLKVAGKLITYAKMLAETLNYQFQSWLLERQTFTLPHLKVFLIRPSQILILLPLEWKSYWKIWNTAKQLAQIVVVLLPLSLLSIFKIILSSILISVLPEIVTSLRYNFMII